MVPFYNAFTYPKIINNSIDMTLSLIFTAFVFCFSSRLADSHSWVTCVDYWGQLTDNQPYDARLCKGFPRSRKIPGSSHLDDIPDAYTPHSDIACQAFRDKDTLDYDVYTDHHPPPVYQHDRTINVIWPGNGHTFPPSEVTLYLTCSSSKKRKDLPLHIFETSQYLIGTFPYDKCTSDLESCVLCVPVNATWKGYCTFMWRWQTWTTCWDAVITDQSSVVEAQAPPNANAGETDSVGSVNNEWMTPHKTMIKYASLGIAGFAGVIVVLSLVKKVRQTRLRKLSNAGDIALLEN